MINKTANVPPLSILVKDHKPIKPGESPKSRPVCASYASMNLHLNDILSKILEPLADRRGGIEVVSSEEFLGEIYKVNHFLCKASFDPECSPKLKKELQSMVLIGADAVSLYPKLRKEQTASIIAEEYLDWTLTWR